MSDKAKKTLMLVGGAGLILGIVAWSSAAHALQGGRKVPPGPPPPPPPSPKIVIDPTRRDDSVPAHQPGSTAGPVEYTIKSGDLPAGVVKVITGDYSYDRYMELVAANPDDADSRRRALRLVDAFSVVYEREGGPAGAPTYVYVDHGGQPNLPNYYGADDPGNPRPGSNVYVHKSFAGYSVAPWAIGQILRIPAAWGALPASLA